MTPYELIYEKKGVRISKNPLMRELIELNELLSLEEKKESVRELSSKNSEKLKKQFDKRRKEAKNYTGGELVLVERQKPSTGASRKLDRAYNGPYEITKSLGRNRYIVKDIEGEQQSLRPYEATMAVVKIKFVAKRERSDKE